MELLKLTEKQQNKILEEFQLKESEVQEIIKKIKIWKEKQTHLPELSDAMIRRLLIYNKFRIERTKEKIDNYFTLRGQYRDLLTGWEKIIPSKHFKCILSMPQVTPKVQRIVIIKLLDPNPDHYDFAKIVNLGLALMQLTLQYDDSNGFYFILDYGNFTFKHFLRLNLPLLYKVYNLLEINVLNDCSQLSDLYPKECLPAEYGGTCSNVRDLLC